MKQGTTISSILVGVLAVGVILYFLLSLWQSFTDPFTTTVAYSFTTVGEGVDANGIIIREETLLPTPTTGLVDILRREGEQVGIGQVVARTYTDTNAMIQQNQLENYQNQVELLDFALADSAEVVSVAKINQDIALAVATLRSTTGSGNYNQLETQVAAVKGNILRRDYIFGGTSTALEMEQKRTLLQEDISNLSKQVVTEVALIRTPISGAFSILVDGFESYSPEMMLDLDLAGLETLLNTPTLSHSDTGGKMITGNTWYFATAVDVEHTKQLRQGQRMTVRFSGDFSQDIQMTLEGLGPEEEGQRILVFSSDRYLEQTTLLRHQNVELIYESYSGLRIPKMSLRMEVSTDSQGNSYETLGVYTVSAGYAEFKPVSMVAEGNEYYVVKPLREDANALRDGNIIVVNAVGLYDGKLLEY